MANYRGPNNTAKTFNTTDVWETIEELQQNVGGSNGAALGTRLTSVEASLADKASKKKTDIWVDVKADYGAKGDGIADDTTAIKNAIAFVKDNPNYVLYFPNGTYNITQLTMLYGAVKIHGQSKYKTIINLNGTGDANNRLLYWNMTDNSYIDGIEIKNLTFVSFNGMRPAIKYANNVTVENVDFIGPGIRLDSVNYFHLNNLSVRDSQNGALSFYTCTWGTISNIIGKGVTECIDFSNCERIAVDTVVVDCPANPTDQNEIVDVGTSRYISINNVVANNCYRGVTIKNENPYDLTNIKVSNCLFTEVTEAGVVFMFKGGSYLPPNDMGTFTVEDCTINSTIAGSRGIKINKMYNDDAKPFQDIIISNCDINVQGQAIAVQTNDANAILVGDISILGSVLKSNNDNALYIRHASNIRVRNTKILTITSKNCVELVSSNNISFFNCSIKNGNKGVNITDCYKIIIDGCNFDNLQSNACALVINSILASSSPLIRFIHNTVKDWGRNNTTSASALGITFNEVTQTYKLISLSGNELIYTPNSFSPYGFGIGGAKVYNAIVANNQYTGITTFMTGTTTSNIDTPTSFVANNISA